MPPKRMKGKGKMDYESLGSAYDSMFGYGGKLGIDEKTMLDLHLGNAINLDLVEFLLTGYFTKYRIYVAKYQRRLWREIKPFKNKDLNITIGFLECTQDILTRESEKVEMNPWLWRDITKIVSKSLAARDLKIPIVEHYDELVSTGIMVNSLQHNLFRFLLKLVCMSSEAKREKGTLVYEGFSISKQTVSATFYEDDVIWDVRCNNQFCWIYDRKKGKEYVGNFDAILMMMDTLGQRICLEIGTLISTSGRVEGTPEAWDLERVISIGDSVLKVYGNKGYEFIGLFESIVVAVILRKNPNPVTNSSLFFDNCRNELEGMIEDGIFDNGIMVFFDLLVAQLLELPNEILSNVFCIYRIWGHPRVDILAGMNKVMKIGTAPKVPAVGVARIINNQFKKMFVMQYYEKHHKYPSLSMLDTRSNYIQECIALGAPISIDHPRYVFHDWDWIMLKQMWTVPETYDICHILSDKAVSPTRSELHASLRAGQGTCLGAQRRNIIRWLTGRATKCKEFLDRVNKLGLDIDDLIIGMYEKEREIKISARMFSLMSERMREYFVLTEELIAEHILPYFPQITMKDPLNIQIKKLWAVSGSSSDESLDPVINVDFEKWNLNFRDGFTRPIFTTMDALFGYDRLINRTHEIFENSYIYSSSGKYEPLTTATGLAIDPPMAYTNHVGGFEGLRQKGWTIATVCLLCYIADRQKLTMNLLGQGDNQVVRLYMPHNYWRNLGFGKKTKIAAAKQNLRNYLCAMDTNFGAAGLPVKLRETWTSTRLCMYGKNMFIDGKAMPQWVKKLLRTYALSNEGTLTVSGVIGTIATNMSAAAHASTSPDIMYVLFLILAEWSLEFLFAYHPFTRKSVREGSQIDIMMPSEERRRKVDSGRINVERLIVTILLVPTAIGGSITIPLTSFIMRGFPDHGTEAYAWLKLLGSVKSQWQSMFRNWYSFIPNETIEFDMLVQSPWSINHMKPPTPGLHSRETVRDWLFSGDFKENTFMKNCEFIMSSFDRKKICKMFCTEEINPLILNELYCTFPQVYLDSVLRRVENTRTITKMAMTLGNEDPIVRLLMDMEHEFLGYLFWRGNQRGDIYSECATEQCRQARNRGWGRKIKGLTTPHPLEFAVQHQCTSRNVTCDGSDYIYTRIDKNGKFPPYLGSNVRTKVMSLQDPTARTEPLITTSSKLAKYAPWLDLGPNTRELIEKNVSIVCNTDIFDNFFDDDHTYFSGSVEHRFNPACASEGCFINYSPQLGSTVFVSTDNMPRYGKGQVNVTLNFQALFCTLQYFSARRFDTTCIHYHLKCEDCIKEVDDKLTDIEEFNNEFDIIYQKRVVKRLKETLGYLNINHAAGLEVSEVPRYMMNLIDFSQIKSDQLERGITWLLGVRAAKMLMYSKKTTSSVMNQEDLQSFPRVYSYKISSIKVIKACIASCLAIKHMRMFKRKGPRDFDEVKRKLKSQLIKMTLDKFKGVASLCLGRTFDPEEDESPPIFNTGEFPESVTGFTSAIRNSVVDELDKMTGYKKRLFRWILPLAGTTFLDQCLLMRVRLLGENNCLDCLRAMVKIEEDPDMEIDCGNRHISKEKSRCLGLMMPLDAVIKCLELKSRTIVPKLLVGGSFLAHSLSWSYPTSVRASSRMVKMNVDPRLRTFLQEREQVILPTRAAYKWDIMISMVKDTSYKNIIVLGDGTGFTSAVCARRFSESTVFPSGLLENGKMIPQDLQSLRPFASRMYSNVSSILLERVSDDITSTKWKREFLTFISELRGKTLIVSDIEGTGNVEKILERFVPEISSLRATDYIIKVYFRTFRVHKSSRQYSNWMCNLRYQEGFISNITIPLQRVICNSDEITEKWGNDVPYMPLESWIKMFHSSYTELRDISLKLTMGIVQRNLISLEIDDLSRPKEVILVRILLYLSANFKVPYEGLAPGDNRKLIDPLLIKIICGIKILLYAMYGERITKREFYQKIGISRAEPEERHKKLKEMQLIIVQWEREIKLSSKEIRASQILRSLVLEYSPKAENNFIPKTMDELYTRVIIPGLEAWRKLTSRYTR